MRKEYGKKGNFITLIVEIVLTVAICFGIAFSSFVELSTQAGNFAVEVTSDYNTLTNDYMRDFKVLRMESEEKIREDISFDEMLEWLQSKDAMYANAIGENVYDGFAFTYKGGYVHSWNYGDYSEYDPASRPWYQAAELAGGEVAVVAPYVTFLSNTDLIDKYDILRMSIVQKYSDEVSFDFDLNVKEINALLADRSTLYKGTISFLFDKDGYILSSSDSDFYGHNINTVDSRISQKLCDALTGGSGGIYGMTLHSAEGMMRMVYSYTDDEGKTLCLLVPLNEVFISNFLFVLLLVCILIGIEIMFYHRNKIQMMNLEESRAELGIKNQELEAANNAKTEFLSRMSHELRTPLNALGGYSALMRENIISGNLDAELLLHNLMYTDRASSYLLRIIDDILDIQNVEFGKIHIEPEEVNVRSFLENVVGVIGMEAEERGIDFTYEEMSGTEEHFIVDGVRLQQVLLNVLHNAVKFTAAGGQVKFTAEKVSADKTQTAGAADKDTADAKDTENTVLKFTISDTGIGMSREFVDTMLFKKFAQENIGNTSPYEGCGIGLAITNQLIEMMGGAIVCDSEKGKGTVFTITLPAEAVKKKRRRREKKELPSYDLSGIRVLLCEDNPMNQDMERRVLVRMNCAVDIADDGKIGLEMFEKSEPGYYDIVLMDIRMPNMDGLQTAKAIRGLQRQDAETVPVLAVSANAFEEDVRASLDAGMNEHLAKPVDAKILYEKIQQYCRTGENYEE